MTVWNSPHGFLRREKFCSKAWFKQERTTANVPCVQGTFYLTSSGPRTQGYHLALTRSSGSSAPLFRTMVGQRRSMDTVVWLGGYKLLAPYTHLHNAYLSILMRKNYHRPIEVFWSTTYTTSRTRHPFPLEVSPETLLSSAFRTALPGEGSVSNGSWDQTPIHWGSRYTSD